MPHAFVSKQTDESVDAAIGVEFPTTAEERIRPGVFSGNPLQRYDGKNHPESRETLQKRDNFLHVQPIASGGAIVQRAGNQSFL